MALSLMASAAPEAMGMRMGWRPLRWRNAMACCVEWETSTGLLYTRLHLAMNW